MERTTAEKLSDLKQAGFRIGYADPADVYTNGRIHASYVHPFAYTEAERPFVIVDGALSECTFGQSSTVVRSNFRSLQRDYGLTFVEVGYSHTDGLGFFPHSVSDAVVDMVIGLVEQYPVYDDSDLSDLEHDEIVASFGQFAYQDWRNEDDEWVQVADLFTESEIETAFWEAVSASGDFPTHDGRDFVWSDHMFADAMMSALTNLVADHFGPVRAEPLFSVRSHGFRL